MWKLRFEDRPGQSLCIVERDGEILGAFRCNKEEYDNFREIFSTGLETLQEQMGTYMWPNQTKQKL